jgi:hypothetical protein
VSRSDLVYKINDIGCFDRLFGQVVVTGYLYRFGAWLMPLMILGAKFRSWANFPWFFKK